MPSVERFEHYCRVCFENFGDRVKYWLSLNEQNMQICYGNWLGVSKGCDDWCAADAQHFRQYAFPGKPVTMGVLSHLHSGEQLRPDAFGLSWILTHFGPPFRFTACFDYEAALNRYYHF